MLWSNTFIPTLKEAPAEAEIPSHQLLLRAGLVRKLAGGLYTFLPAGLRLTKSGKLVGDMNKLQMSFSGCAIVKNGNGFWAQRTKK